MIGAQAGAIGVIALLWLAFLADVVPLASPTELAAAASLTVIVAGWGTVLGRGIRAAMLPLADYTTEHRREPARVI